MMLQTNSLVKLEWQIKQRIILFMAGLVVSGLTAFPIESELRIAHQLLKSDSNSALSTWIELVYFAVNETNSRFSFISYGTDWLAFAHLIIAIAFVGPLRDPVRNRWVIEFGIIACISIFPFAFVAGYVRNIPVFWRIIDCMFGIIGGLTLWSCYKKIRLVEKIKLFEV